jgi:HSP20 family protein
MRTLEPPTGLISLRNEMDRLFDRFWDPDSPEAPLGRWTPTVDLSETKEDFTLRFEVPGMDPKDIQIMLHEQVLTIRGEKNREEEEKEERFYRTERSYGAFARSVRLPVAVDAKKVNATFKNGLLTIHIAKAPTGNGAMIPIRTQ